MSKEAILLFLAAIQSIAAVIATLQILGVNMNVAQRGWLFLAILLFHLRPHGRIGCGVKMLALSVIGTTLI